MYIFYFLVKCVSLVLYSRRPYVLVELADVDFVPGKGEYFSFVAQLKFFALVSLLECTNKVMPFLKAMRLLPHLVRCK